MDEKRLNKTATALQLTLSSFIIMVTLIGGLLWTRAELENHSGRLKRAESDIKNLDEFAGETANNRFTSDQGRVLEQRVHRLELWTTQAPPLWFREIFREFKADMKDEIRVLRGEIQDIRIKLIPIVEKLE